VKASERVGEPVGLPRIFSKIK